jgi:hypothetical protein
VRELAALSALAALGSGLAVAKRDERGRRLFVASETRHAVACYRRFPESVRKAPNWRGSVRLFVLRDGIVTVGSSHHVQKGRTGTWEVSGLAIGIECVLSTMVGALAGVFRKNAPKMFFVEARFCGMLAGPL